MSKDSNTGKVIAIIIAILIIGTAMYYRVDNTPDPLPPAKVRPELGGAGSNHDHLAMIISINGEVYDFSAEKYQLQSPLIHFEPYNGVENGIYVHLHAIGLIIYDLFDTIDVTLDDECISFGIGQTYCEDDTNKLTILLNHREISAENLHFYELRQNDRLLINYGSESDAQLRMNSNDTVFDLPDDL